MQIFEPLDKPIQEINDVTLCVIDCLDILRARVALRNSMRYLQFKRSIILSNIKQSIPEAEVIEIAPIKSKEAYSYFILNYLKDYFDTSHIILMQWDGYIVNASAWTNEFLEYDYIGAPWHMHDHLVGNGGFSLRSKKLLETTSQFRFQKYHPEDNAICLWNRNYFIERGIKFAPYEIAKRFSIENESYEGSLGWHGGNEPPDFIKWYKKLYEERKVL